MELGKNFMGDIVIIGGGFSGLEAARILSRQRQRLDLRRVLLVDKKATFDFLPVLPDVIGSRVRREHVILDLAAYCETLRVNFENAEVTRVDTGSGDIFLNNGHVLSYEFLVIACGSVTNFYNLAQVEKYALKLDTAQDAQIIQSTVMAYPSRKILVVGGGYTGVEVAANLACLLRRRGVLKYSISLIEKGEDILNVLPEEMRTYSRVVLSALRVDIHGSCSIKEIDERHVKLTNGLEFDDYLLIWAAGVKTPPFVQGLPYEKDGQGRLCVDYQMRVSPQCFAIGDAASFKHHGKVLRMAVQFSLCQAQTAAGNILRLIKGEKKLLAYRPLDLGFLVPLANRKACGKVLAFRVKGVLGWVFHYLMCVYRSTGLRNKWGIFCDAFLR